MKDWQRPCPQCDGPMDAGSKRCHGCRIASTTTEGRFAAKVAPEPNTGCWLWMGATEADGYGRISVKGEGRGVIYAHRLAYELFVGPVPDGLCVCHRCDVRCCVNPEHLFLGTPAENDADKVRKGRQARGRQNGQAKLAPEQVREIFTSPDSYRVLAKRYGVYESAIWRIKKRINWKHITKSVGVDQ